MNLRTKHLYIHIPFCKSICDYCDFLRYVETQKNIEIYVKKIVQEIKNTCKFNQFETIYIGGGTPNFLNPSTLDFLLSTLNKYLSKTYEFTIECNPEHLNLSQCRIFNKNKINRVSIGAQTINTKLLHKFHRTHNLKNVTQAIKNLRKVGINNISLDFIYGFNELTDVDIKNTVNFIKSYKIPHVSWYALELKQGSMLYKNKYGIDENVIESQLKLIIKSMNAINYERYEVSNWSKASKFQSIHNKAYWLTEDWKAIGLGSYGFERGIYYENIGKILRWKQKQIKYSIKDYYFQIMLMGLRLKKGLDLSNPKYQKAFNFYKNKLTMVHIDHNHLVANNINLLDNILLELL
ncbi:MAG: radical SAM family heme chaperone HemW [Mycoplasmataceae bacterium]|nr:radical SAM family heme chaperone HemW [Mycoplasmataceae bacterium]